jgi:hypothetical protein
MKNTFKTLSLVFIGSMLVASCNQNKKADEMNSDTEVSDSTQMDSVSVTPVADSKEFPGAELKIASITSEKVGNDSAKITVKYTVNNFKLTEQTEHEHHMANSMEGQHIHFILDNEPYAALYKPEHTAMVPLNSEHYLLSFLSRSFHESIKTPEASKLVKFKIDGNGKLTQMPAPTDASLFYSRPKGEYKGADTETVLLDFFVMNTDIGADGNKVKADINGQEFMLDHWQPYQIKGMPMGENVVKLTLVDKDGKEMAGDNVSVTRTITLSE